MRMEFIPKKMTTILVVDDEPKIVKTARAYLENAGETLTVLGGANEPILSFAYDDAWEPSTVRVRKRLKKKVVVVGGGVPSVYWDLNLGEAALWRVSTVTGAVLA